MEVTDKLQTEATSVKNKGERGFNNTREHSHEILFKWDAGPVQQQCCWSACHWDVSAVSWKDEGQGSLITEHSHKVLTFGNHGTLIRLLPGQGTNPHWTSCCHELFSVCSQSDALSFPLLWSNHLVFAYFYWWITVNSSLLQISSKCRNPQVMRVFLRSGGDMSLHHVSSMCLNY